MTKGVRGKAIKMRSKYNKDKLQFEASTTSKYEKSWNS